jgi:hypothetical protein
MMKFIHGKIYKIECEYGVFIAEYRGFDLVEGYLLFWFEGDTCATPVYEDYLKVIKSYE